MKGKVVVLAIVVLIALLVVTPSLAAGPRNGQSQRHAAITRRQGGGGGGGGQADGSFKLYGTIQALDDDAMTIGVLVETPLRYEGDYITVQTTESTRFKECDHGTSYRITFEELIVGRSVRIAGTVAGDGYLIADRVIQYVP